VAETGDCVSQIQLHHLGCMLLFRLNFAKVFQNHLYLPSAYLSLTMSRQFGLGLYLTDDPVKLRA
jgi:hypothetical protein